MKGFPPLINFFFVQAFFFGNGKFPERKMFRKAQKNSQQQILLALSIFLVFPFQHHP